MKKTLKKIAVLIFATLLFVIPSATVLAATSTPVLKFSTSTAKYYEYEPTPYILQANISTGLDDIYATGGNWYCPAYKNFNLVVNNNTSSSFRITILRYTTPGGPQFTVEYNSVMSGVGGGVMLGTYASDSYFKVLITGVTTTYVTSYGGYYE